jgi:hypothetical protein
VVADPARVGSFGERRVKVANASLTADAEPVP